VRKSAAARTSTEGGAITAESDLTVLPWPFWLLRYVAANSEQAMWDAIWSVGGSPPYGGVGWEEASAVYNLLEQYRGPGRAPDDAYAAVERHLAGRPNDVLALEVFRIHDHIASDPTNVGSEDVEAGLDLAQRLDHMGLMCYFAMLQSQRAYEHQDIGAAKEISLQVLPVLMTLFADDPVYGLQLAKTAQSAASFAVMDGDVESGRLAAQVLRQLGDEDRLGSLRDSLL